MRKALVVAVVVGCFHSASWAKYIATGPFEGNVCRGIGIEVCDLRKIAAVRGDDGRLYEVTTTFDSVTEYSESKKRCWVTTKRKGGGLFSWAINAAKQPVFFERTTAGRLEEIDVDYLTFPCVKR